jgi:hypothetical protein
VLPSVPIRRLPNYATLLVVIAVFTLLIVSPAAHAQVGTGKVCVLAFNDANRSGTRGLGEGLLPDIGVNLMVNQNVIIANHVTDTKEPFCFDNLPPQQYTVGFSSPLYEPTTSTGFTFSLSSGEAPLKEFGAVLKATPVDPTGSSSGLDIEMTTPVRIGLSAVGAVVVMILFAGIGMVIYGLFVRRQPR